MYKLNIGNILDFNRWFFLIGLISLILRLLVINGLIAESND